jgi:hypothetical protein
VRIDVGYGAGGGVGSREDREEGVAEGGGRQGLREGHASVEVKTEAGEGSDCLQHSDDDFMHAFSFACAAQSSSSTVAGARKSSSSASRGSSAGGVGGHGGGGNVVESVASTGQQRGRRERGRASAPASASGARSQADPQTSNSQPNAQPAKRYVLVSGTISTDWTSRLAEWLVFRMLVVNLQVVLEASLSEGPTELLCNKELQKRRA